MSIFVPGILCYTDAVMKISMKEVRHMLQPKSITPMRTAKIGYIIMSVICCFLGVMLVVFPEISASVLGVMMGIMMVLFGAVKLVGYFSKDLYRLAFQYDLAFGIFLIALGIVVLIRPDNAMSFICIVLGISVLADGLFKIQIAFDSKRFGLKLWWLIFVFAVLTGMLGMLLVFRPTESVPILMVLVGSSLFLEGLLSLSTVLTAVKIVRYQMPDIVEVDFYEERGVKK